jgi:hypothetical protein
LHQSPRGWGRTDVQALRRFCMVWDLVFPDPGEMLPTNRIAKNGEEKCTLRKAATS